MHPHLSKIKKRSHLPTVIKGGIVFLVLVGFFVYEIYYSGERKPRSSKLNALDRNQQWNVNSSPLNNDSFSPLVTFIRLFLDRFVYFLSVFVFQMK
jgi:hypothetical protein